MNVINDKALDVALGNSRKTKSWKNRPMLWSELLSRLATTTRTPETIAEYRAMGKTRQSDIKDVGGFVGGYCNNGSRSDIRFRSILCLDADYADGEVWDDWGLIYGSAAAMYSTHKHTPNKPRLRLVIPLSRNVDVDEYQAVGRKVAETLGIDKFDDTTYQPQRMMYWPSTSQDGEYVFEYLDAPLLDPDTVLSTYHDWRDVSSWPMSSRVAEVAKRTATRQEDPTTKGGIVGAFCRAYTIREAIETYVPTYQPCDDPNRYTYTEGSTAAGVVIYEDKWAYSHHGTDPASGHLCNAWDLVRLHRFRALDADCDPDTKVNNLPSYKAMAQLATEDHKVRAQRVADRTAEATEDYAAPVEDGDWRGLLKITDKGILAQTIENVTIILTHDPQLAGRIGLNEMEHSITVLASLPWDKAKKRRQWVDNDDAQLRHYLEKYYGLTGKDRIYDAVQVVAQDAAFHPVRDYLDGCAWDGVPRVDTLLIDYLGAEDNEYTRSVTRKTLAAAVARIYNPGCKFDYMLTLQGKQGIGKSALISKLGGKWFSDSFSTVQGKEAYEQVLGVWIMEVGELAGMKKAEAENIKLFISKQVDRFRPAYGRRTQEFPRQCVFIGTTNETQFLRDATGNRRFWVVGTPNEPTKSIWELTPETICLIWAEAVELFRAGEPLYLSREMEQQARAVQETYEEESPWSGLIADYLDRPLPEDWEDMDLNNRVNWLCDELGNPTGTVRRRYVCTIEIWVEALGQKRAQFDRYKGKEIREIMAKMDGWVARGNKKRTFVHYGRQRYFERVE